MILSRAAVLSWTFLSLSAADVSPAVHIDQVGYLPDAAKIAVIAVSSPASQFSVRRTTGGQTVFKGQLSDPRHDELSGDTVQLADFSALRADGDYYLDIVGLGRSYDFGIHRDVFSRAFYLTMRGYYAQRCGTKVDLSPDFPSFQHAACHLVGAYDASSGKTGPHASAGGWHDAGDYGRYVVNSGITTGTLLWAWEIYHGRLGSINLNIPESGSKVPDMLNEIRWNLDWMLSMQDEDGGVWHKQTSTNFSGFVMPEADKAPSLVIGTGSAPFKSSCATGDFAAVMAIASRAFAPYDPAYAKKTLQAARTAWTWLSQNPNVTFSNPRGVNTGEYGDRDCSDERLWAAAELYRTTNDEQYNKYFLANYESFLSSAAKPPDWASVGAMGLWTYAMAGRSNEAVTAIKNATLKAADDIANRTIASPYQISMQNSDYVWGSNGVAANYSVLLLISNVLHPDPRYTNAAFENLHYLLGRNAFSVSWVTQLGSNPFRHPHHRPSGADNNPEPWPGLLSGGPNPGRQDQAMQKVPKGPPMRMWLDDQASYSSNEIAINWNAPLVFVLAAALPDTPTHAKH
ncbi:MAG: glycoside hydrolase family 9 protein [Bryobacteraceae bacterium]